MSDPTISGRSRLNRVERVGMEYPHLTKIRIPAEWTPIIDCLDEQDQERLRKAGKEGVTIQKVSITASSKPLRWATDINGREVEAKSGGVKQDICSLCISRGETTDFVLSGRVEVAFRLLFLRSADTVASDAIAILTLRKD